DREPCHDRLAEHDQANRDYSGDQYDLQLGSHAGTMRRKRNRGESGPLTLAQAVRAQVRIIVGCTSCQRQVGFGPAELGREGASCGGAFIVIDWAKRLVCTLCGARAADFVARLRTKPFQFDDTGALLNMRLWCRLRVLALSDVEPTLSSRSDWPR